ncbi:MAG TPA: amidohydrolase family protein [Polyangia bacterium]|nr:amidohydrolase family protein [Polyangia bacterium]
MSPAYDLILRNGIVFDGTGRPGVHADLGIAEGRVRALQPHLPGQGTREIDVAGRWIMPGFFDLHTHYDAEVEALPGLSESVRHGVTSVVFGNCSLSAALGTSEQLLDLFCRVESLPRELLTRWFGGGIPWNSVTGYYNHLETLPLGPNVASFLGHSNVRMAVMGTERSLHQPHATDEELGRMRDIVKEAMDAGYLGLSIDMLPWHRMDGQAYRGISVPSQQAHPSEHALLADIVRDHGRVLQATPNALTKSTVLRLLGYSTGLGRRPLKTTIVAAMDVKTDRKVWRLALALAQIANRLLEADIRWQALAEPFLNYCDGVITPLFEEFPAGVEAISATPEARRALLGDPEFRRRFRAEWEDTGQRVFHRDLGQMHVVSAPDSALVGRSFADIARESGQEPLDGFLDLLARYDTELRWRTEVSNDRSGPRLRLLGHPYTLPGFNDSGAHNRNMAFHDGALQLLAQAQAHPEELPIARAVHRLTGETAAWLGLDAGRLREGDVADVTVLDPERLRSGLGGPVEYPDPELGGVMRLVKRSDGVVTQVLIGGQVVYEGQTFVPDYGRRKYGRLLRAGHAAAGATNH